MNQITRFMSVVNAGRAMQRYYYASVFMHNCGGCFGYGDRNGSYPAAVDDTYYSHCVYSAALRIRVSTSREMY